MRRENTTTDANLWKGYAQRFVVKSEETSGSLIRQAGAKRAAAGGPSVAFRRESNLGMMREGLRAIADHKANDVAVGRRAILRLLSSGDVSTPNSAIQPRALQPRGGRSGDGPD